MKLKSKKILITGADGFIGTNLTKRLKNLGYTVDTYNLGDGNNITDSENIKKFIRRKYNFIYHLAGISGATQDSKMLKACLDINSMATFKIIEFILKYSPNTKLILSGSRLEYGKPKYLPVDEKHPTSPNSMYGLTKLIASQISVASINAGLKVTIFRTSNVYGPHLKSRFKGYNVINYFVDLALKNQQITIFGDGKQKRDYIFIDDLVDAFVLGLESKTSGNIYNLGYGTGIEFRKMIEIIVKTVGKGSLKYVAWPADYKIVETGDYVTDINKIRTELGFIPKTNFEDGIQKTVLAKL